MKKSDIDAVIARHRQLSDREQYLRFFIPTRTTWNGSPGKVVTRTAENYAVGASEGDELIGVANYSRGDDPAVAEVAVAVAHDDHLRGVGTALLQHLGGVARRNGIRYFTVDVLVENGLMLKALRDPGRGSATTCGPPEVRVRVDLCGRYGRTPAPQTEANDRGFTE